MEEVYNQAPRVQDVVLIGPPNVGKSTLATLLGCHLSQPVHSLDALRRAYFEEIGFDMAFNLELNASQGTGAMLQYWGVFAPHALERFFTDQAGILDIGGGTPVASLPHLKRRIATAFAPFEQVVLLLPDVDVEASLAILAARVPDAPSDLTTAQRFYLEQPSYAELATHTVFTGTDPPDQVARRVLDVLRRVPSPRSAPRTGRTN